MLISDLSIGDLLSEENQYQDYLEEIEDEYITNLSLSCASSLRKWLRQSEKFLCRTNGTLSFTFCQSWWKNFHFYFLKSISIERRFALLHLCQSRWKNFHFYFLKSISIEIRFALLQFPLRWLNIQFLKSFCGNALFFTLIMLTGKSSPSISLSKIYAG